MPKLNSPITDFETLPRFERITSPHATARNGARRGTKPVIRSRKRKPEETNSLHLRNILRLAEPDSREVILDSMQSTSDKLSIEANMFVIPSRMIGAMCLRSSEIFKAYDTMRDFGVGSRAENFNYRVGAFIKERSYEDDTLFAKVQNIDVTRKANQGRFEVSLVLDDTTESFDHERNHLASRLSSSIILPAEETKPTVKVAEAYFESHANQYAEELIGQAIVGSVIGFREIKPFTHNFVITELPDSYQV